MSDLDSSARRTPLSIIYLPPSALIPNANNPRRHSKKQINQVKCSMRTFGPIVPVLTDAAGKIIAGHCRVLAAQQLRLQEIPTICIEHMSPEQIKAFMVADNRLSELSSWDDALLAKTLRDLSEVELDFNIEDIGFSMDEIELRIEALDADQDGTPDPDDQVPDMSDEPNVCETGDLWRLGQNLVMQGDATNLSDIEKLMNGQHAAMTFTDPPYNVNYGNSAKDEMRGTHRPILNDNLGEGFEAFLQQVCAHILSVTDGAIYMCMSSSELHLLQDVFVKSGGHWSTFIIWAKQTFTLGRSDYQRQYEPILYGWREGMKRYWCDARDQGDVWFVDKPVKNDLHPTMKPVELVIRALRNSSRRGDIVLDPFLGSGSTLIAAERTDRICYGLELDPRYVDTIIRRWQRHTGDDAIHAVTGEKFNDIAARKG